MAEDDYDFRRARGANKNEFYTQLTDINKEMEHYEDKFRGKIVYCNCDDPRFSNFFHYFSHKFEILGLKKLITTCYKNDNRDLFSMHDKEKAVWLEYTGDKKNKQPDPEEIEVKPLKGDGDFRSEECIEILKKADIVCTNPPFSLFREFVAQLMKYEKQFIIMGNVNAIVLKEIFPLVMANRMWLGPSISSGDREFGVPDSYPLKAAGCRVDDNGKKFIRIKGVRWWTNLDHKKRHEFLDPPLSYHKGDYPELDNYNAINVNAVRNIPCDYGGYMAVPVTFIDKWNPDEFEIMGITRSWFDNAGIIKPSVETHDPVLNGETLFTRLIIRRK